MADLAGRWHLAGQPDGADQIERALTRIDAVEPQVQAWVEVDRQARRKRVGEVSDSPASALSGVPFAVKDIVDVAGLPTRCGSEQRRDTAPATTDAALVARLRRAGAVPIGKTVTTEFAYFAPGPTDNPAAPGHTPGGSSSGSAAAVAAGMVPLAIGSQTAGSLTRPASFCGVAGLVLTRGLLPTTGVVGLAPSLDSMGLLTASVADLAVALSALLPQPSRAPAPPRSVLLWLPHDLDLDPAMVRATEHAAARLRGDGLAVIEFDDAADDLAAQLIEDQQIVMAYEAARERAAELALGGLSAPLTELLTTGGQIGETDYRDAVERLAAAGATVAGWFAEHAAVLAPAALGPAPAGLTATGSPVLSRGWQGLGLPAVTVPGQRHPDGRPLGVQLLGAPDDDHALVQLGCRLERLIT